MAKRLKTNVDPLTLTKWAKLSGILKLLSNSHMNRAILKHRAQSERSRRNLVEIRIRRSEFCDSKNDLRRIPTKRLICQEVLNSTFPPVYDDKQQDIGFRFKREARAPTTVRCRNNHRRFTETSIVLQTVLFSIERGAPLDSSAYVNHSLRISFFCFGNARCLDISSLVRGESIELSRSILFLGPVLGCGSKPSTKRTDGDVSIAVRRGMATC